jgi:dUTP pyrophosphatase
MEDFSLRSLERRLVPTGLSFDIPEGYEIQVRPKSGLSLNKGLSVLNTPGTVDSGWTDEIKVILVNLSDTTVEITKGMKIAQAVLCPVVNGGKVEFKKLDEIPSKDRNKNGFGSTGV